MIRERDQYEGPRSNRRTLADSVRALLRASERAYVVLALLLFAEAFVPLVARMSGRSTSAGADGSPLIQGLYLLVYVLLVVLILAHWRRVLQALRRSYYVWLPVGVAVASLSWSVAPELTLRRGAALGATTLFGVYLAARFELRGVVRLLGWTMLIAALVSPFVVALAPELGMHTTDSHSGAWRGVFGNKNTLGRSMVLGSLSWLILARDSDRSSRMWAFAAAGGMAVMILLSQSVTALVAWTALTLLLLSHGIVRSNWLRLVPLAIFGTLVGGFIAGQIIAYREGLLALVGRDPSLTGRTELWITVLGLIQSRPWLGYGFGAFWQGSVADTRWVWDEVGWTTPHAHNGWLDLWLELGAVGVTMFALALLFLALRALRLARARGESYALWPALFVGFLFLYNLVESATLQHNNLQWLMFVAVASAIVYPADPPTGTRAATGDPETRIPQPTLRTSLGVRIRRFQRSK